ncbi:MAG: hypothetical protein JO082_10425 [Mycobacterium sp.]|nr:hypothetical protein [Mycobacterium sp.]
MASQEVVRASPVGAPPVPRVPPVVEAALLVERARLAVVLAALPGERARLAVVLAALAVAGEVLPVVAGASAVAVGEAAVLLAVVVVRSALASVPGSVAG